MSDRSVIGYLSCASREKQCFVRGDCSPGPLRGGHQFVCQSTCGKSAFGTGSYVTFVSNAKLDDTRGGTVLVSLSYTSREKQCFV